ncbi:MAG: NAD(P)-dependent oxidoreductase [Deltaproteobacteria bacterium]|nr:NAD(P)-dependent oxidoreductase [Deltaproteobacteria bacterium]
MAYRIKRLNLVTGACGFTGSHLVKRLLDGGEEVVATDLAGAFEHPKTKFISERIGLDFKHPSCRVIPADLTRRETLKKTFEHRITHVFHTASLYDYSAPLDVLMKINVDGTVNLLDLAVGCGTLRRFIHWSTCGVYGKPYPLNDPRRNTPFTEDGSPSPKNTPLDRNGPAGADLVNDYSVSKWRQEQIAWKCHRERGLPLTVLRPAPLYGPGGDYGHGGIVIAVHQGLLPCIPADTRNYITTSVHIEDMAGFACHIAGRESGIGRDFNVVDDSVISYHEFLHYIALILGRRLTDLPVVKQTWLRPGMIAAAKAWLVLEQKFGVPRVRVFEVGSATYMASSYWISNRKSKETGYTYRYPDVREGLRDTVDWFRRAGWLDKGYRPRSAWREYADA